MFYKDFLRLNEKKKRHLSVFLLVPILLGFLKGKHKISCVSMSLQQQKVFLSPAFVLDSRPLHQETDVSAVTAVLQRSRFCWCAWQVKLPWSKLVCFLFIYSFYIGCVCVHECVWQAVRRACNRLTCPRLQTDGQVGKMETRWEVGVQKEES